MLSETHFPFLAEKGHVISLVGGGGKTTLLYAFARHCAAKGWRVLVSTTTHIRQPGENYAADEAALASLWAAGRYAVAGVPAEQGKLTALAAGAADLLDGTGGYGSSGSGRCKTDALQSSGGP